MLNLYPYNPGHLLVCPYRHVADYTDLDEEETAELAAFTQTAMRVSARSAGRTGSTSGMNQGGVAGAGIAAHLHQHVVPRWGGDTNFMPVIGRTKVLPQLWPTPGSCSPPPGPPNSPSAAGDTPSAAWGGGVGAAS